MCIDRSLVAVPLLAAVVGALALCMSGCHADGCTRNSDCASGYICGAHALCEPQPDAAPGRDGGADAGADAAPGDASPPDVDASDAASPDAASPDAATLDAATPGAAAPGAATIDAREIP